MFGIVASHTVTNTGEDKLSRYTSLLWTVFHLLWKGFIRSYNPMEEYS